MVRDVDPENVDFREFFSSGSDNEVNGGAAGSEAEFDKDAEQLARSHYAKVSRSKLRQAPSLDALGPKYAGRNVKKSDIISEDEADDLSELDEEQQMQMDVSDISESEQSASDDDNDENELVNQFSRMAKEDKKLIKNLSKSASQDAEKGQAVRNQIAIYESLLASRIKIQQCLNAVNTAPEDVASVFDMDSLAGLIGNLLELKECMAVDSELCDKPMASSRKNASGKQFFRAAMKDNMSFDNQNMDTALDTTIEKWNRKVQLAQVGSKSLKALNQTVPDQIRNLIATDRDRLFKRTQTLRATEVKQSKTEPESAEDITDNSMLFDDNDYYQILLRDFIDTKTTDNVDPLEISRQWAKLKSMHSKKQKKDVERRASKGRKVRYDVHEKLQNFMVPIYDGIHVGVTRWHDEMTSELFRTIQKVYT